MNKPNRNENIFDELDQDIEEFKTAIKISRQERILKTQRRILQVFLVILLILATAYICVGIHRELDIAGNNVLIFSRLPQDIYQEDFKN